MKKLKLGRTGLDISQVILGGGWVGGLFIDPNFDIKRQVAKIPYNRQREINRSEFKIDVVANEQHILPHCHEIVLNQVSVSSLSSHLSF